MVALRLQRLVGCFHCLAVWVATGVVLVVHDLTWWSLLPGRQWQEPCRSSSAGSEGRCGTGGWTMTFDGCCGQPRAARQRRRDPAERLPPNPTPKRGIPMIFLGSGGVTSVRARRA